VHISTASTTDATTATSPRQYRPTHMHAANSHYNHNVIRSL
jgi:hypothetical protein